MPEEVKRIDIAEFRERGYLQEANRQFFHPLGLAVEIIVDEETGKERLGGVWDYRDDPEGILFPRETLATPEAREKADRVTNERIEKSKVRYRRYGYIIQPLAPPQE